MYLDVSANKTREQKVKDGAEQLHSVNVMHFGSLHGSRKV